MVAINGNTTVRFDVSMASADAVKTIVIKDDGKLFFDPNMNTKLFVSNLIVLPGGELEVGTEANPIPAHLTAEINFADKPLDTNFDPSQYGNGLIALGKVTMVGASKSDTFIRLAVEPRAGDTTLTLSEPAIGWRVGDKLILPDSHLVTDYERNTNYSNQLETLTIQDISPDGLVITLQSALAFDHRGARDINGVLDSMPHVANRSRNVIVKSESASGNRGHVIFTYRADVNVQYVQFGGLGRSTGSNQDDRNAIQFRHLLGPAAPQTNGYQYTFVGNSVFCPLNPMPFIWGINVNDSHYGLIADNVLFNWAGAALVTKTGAEIGNVIERNIVIRTTGNAHREDEDALAGTGFWFRGPDNYVRDNVATAINSEGDDIYSYGFNYYGRFVGTVQVPVAQGSSQRQSRNMNNTPIRQFEGNEVYGASISGLSLWWLGTVDDNPYANAQESVVKDFKVWHHGFAGIFSYPVNRVTIDGLVVRGNISALENDINFNNVGIYFSDYMGHDFVVQNSDIQNVRNGIYAPINVGRVPTMNTTIIKDSFLANITNIIVSPPRSVNGSGDLSPKRLEVRNVTFAHPPSINQNQWTDIEMDYVIQDNAGTSNLNVADLVFVYDFNGDPDDDFQVFYTQTAPADAEDREFIDGKVKYL
ncbi:MAG: G8 domain-containing protein [Gemmataceae bacterium]|nr:G8 domain-containing protein [Gemmataceae bacterium]